VEEYPLQTSKNSQQMGQQSFEAEISLEC